MNFERFFFAYGRQRIGNKLFPCPVLRCRGQFDKTFNYRAMVATVDLMVICRMHCASSSWNADRCCPDVTLILFHMYVECPLHMDNPYT